MTRPALAALLALSIAVPALAEARDKSPYAVRNPATGKIARDPQVRRDFVKSHPCPATGRSSGACPGYQVDHVAPLQRGGPDSTSNMQWLTVDQHKAKTAQEAAQR